MRPQRRRVWRLVSPTRTEALATALAPTLPLATRVQSLQAGFRQQAGSRVAGMQAYRQAVSTMSPGCPPVHRQLLKRVWVHAVHLAAWRGGPWERPTYWQQAGRAQRRGAEGRYRSGRFAGGRVSKLGWACTALPAPRGRPHVCRPSCLAPMLGIAMLARFTTDSTLGGMQRTLPALCAGCSTSPQRNGHTPPCVP